MNESAKAIDRRPIATRNRKWAQSATAWLAERNVSPNGISIAGMCAGIAAGVALGLTSVEYNRVNRKATSNVSVSAFSDSLFSEARSVTLATWQTIGITGRFFC
jgi:hypothetical protein